MVMITEVSVQITEVGVAPRANGAPWKGLADTECLGDRMIDGLVPTGLSPAIDAAWHTRYKAKT